MTTTAHTPTEPAPDLGRLLRPASIAAVGGAAAAEVIRQCRRMGFAGTIHPVHPSKTEIEGLPAYRSVADLPEAPDAAFVGVNRHVAVDVVRALAARGAGGAVCYASGFRESGGDGDALQSALIAAAGEMPVLGPNCYGLINYLDGALLWPDQHGGRRREGGVALIVQSSNIAINLTMDRRGLPVAYVLTLGNRAGLGVADGISAVVDDPRVSAVGVLMEGFDDVDGFVRAARTAQAAGVPIVALRGGRSEAGQGLARTHTASLGSSSRLASALLRRLGVGEVGSLEAFVETLKLLHAVGPLPGADLASMSSSGGEAILMADAVLGRGARFTDFTPDQRAAIAATVHELVTVSNPMDYHTFMWGDAAAMADTFAAVMRTGVDLTLEVLDLPRGDRCDDTLWRPSLEALIEAKARTGGRAALLATLAEGLPEDVAERCMAAGIAPLTGMDAALTAIETAARIGRAHAVPGLPHAPVRASTGTADRVTRTLTEPVAKAELAAHGVPVPEGRTLNADAEGAQAVAAAEAVGLPVVAKAVGGHLAHKTEVGAVALNLATAEAVSAAARRLADLGPELLIERMVNDGVAELLVGYQHDPRLGGFLVIGSGGVLVELVGDSAALPLPVARDEVEAALDGLRVGRLLDGHRAREAGDRDAAVDAILAIGHYCTANVDRLVELDVNPLIVRPQGRGAVAADALIRVLDAADAAHDTTRDQDAKGETAT